MLRFDDHRNLSPSNTGVTARCERRLWLNVHHIRFEIGPDLRDQNQMNEQLKEIGFHAEVVLPDLSRIDLWHPDEKLCVEVKHDPPSYSHFIQVWEMQSRLHRLGVEHAEFQLWYAQEHEADVRMFCRDSGGDWMPTIGGFLAILVEKIAPDDLKSLNKIRSRSRDIVALPSPPTAFTPDHGNCRECGYSEFCHC